MYSELSLYTLQKMDIIPWVIREGSLLANLRKPRLYVFSDSESTEKEQELLKNILRSLPEESFQIKALHAEPQELTASDHCLDFRSLPTPPALPSLSDLLKQPELKKQVYQHLASLHA